MSNGLSLTAPTSFVEADGVRFAYRRLGVADGVTLVFLQHITGTMDSWDPCVVDGFARVRPVVLVDNAGVGRSGGTTPDTVHAMADDVVAFIAAVGLGRVDHLGFSLGGFVALDVATRHPEPVRRMILAGTGPEGGEGIELLGQVLARGRQASPEEPRLFLFFDQTEVSQRAGRAFLCLTRGCSCTPTRATARCSSMRRSSCARGCNSWRRAGMPEEARSTRPAVAGERQVEVAVLAGPSA